MMSFSVLVCKIIVYTQYVAEEMKCDSDIKHSTR